MHRHRKSVNLIRTETHIKVQNSGYRWALCCTYVYVMANTQQKASDDKDCHTSLLSQGGASDLQAYSLYETRTIFCFVTLMLLIHFLHVKINKKMAKQHTNFPSPWLTIFCISSFRISLQPTLEVFISCTPLLYQFLPWSCLKHLIYKEMTHWELDVIDMLFNSLS